jgi:magnesium transporter
MSNINGNGTMLTQQIVEDLLENHSFKELRGLLKEKEVADLADIFSNLDIAECIAALRLISRERRPSLFSDLEFDRQQELIEELPDVMSSSLLNEMEPDNRTKLLESLPQDICDVLLLKLSPQEREIASQLLSYPEDSVGRLMTSDFLTLNENMDVSSALKQIQWSRALPEEFLHYLFVTGADGKLIGEASLASLVVCDPPSALIRDMMKKTHVSLSPFDPQQRAVELFRKYDHLYIPVIDQNKKIIGIVTADDVFEVAEEEATEDIHQFGGHGALEEGYFQTPMFTMFRKRAGALAVLFVSGFLTSEALRVYHDTLSQWGFLTFFIPLIIASGGNSGTQAASLIIRGIAINEFSLKDSWRVLLKEIPVGILLGLILAALWCVRAYFMNLSGPVTLTVSLSIILIVLFGVIAGSMLPFFFRAVRLDPAVVSSPFISTLVDVTGILIFLNLAIVIFNYFGSVYVD